MNKIAVIGAGLSGMASAIELLKKGYEVHVFEKNRTPGGKMMRIEENGFSFDYGPNTMTMPHVFQNVLNHTPLQHEKIPFMKIDRHTRNHFMDGREFIQSIHREEVEEQLVNEFHENPDGYKKYLQEVKRLYQLAENEFFERTFVHTKDYLSLSLMRSMMKVRPFQSMADFHRQFFRDSSIQSVFNRYATYIGSSPYKAPATFSLIGHLEMNDGVYYVQGGNTKIASYFASAIEELGGSLHYDTAITHIDCKEKGKTILTFQNKEKAQFDSVVVATDRLYAVRHLFSEETFSKEKKAIANVEPSISAFVLLLGLRERNTSLFHHEVFFPSSYQDEFKDLFVNKKLPEDPTIYFSHSATTDPNRTHGSNLFVLVNAPATGHLQQEVIEAYADKMISSLEQKGVFKREEIVFKKIFPPQFVEDEFHSLKGALYGPSSNSLRGAFFRPGNQSKKYPQLFFTGGSTHPGGGSPMVILSGKNTAKLVDHYLLNRSYQE